MANAKQMPSGNWRVQIYLGINKEGKKEKKSITAPTRWQAEMLAAKFIQNMQLAKSRFTIAQAVRDYIDSKKNVLSPSTVMRTFSRRGSRASWILTASHCRERSMRMR